MTLKWNSMPQGVTGVDTVGGGAPPNPSYTLPGCQPNIQGTAGACVCLYNQRLLFVCFSCVLRGGPQALPSPLQHVGP